MFRMIKIHFYYLFNKMMIYIVLITCLIVILSLLLSEKNMLSYLDNVYPLIKIITVLVGIFIYSYSISDARDYYFYFYVGEVSRVKYMFTKLISIFVLNLFIILIVYLLFLVFSNVMIDDYYYFSLIHLRFIMVLILSNVYGLMSFIIILLINNQFLMLIPFGLFILGDNLDNFSFILLNDKTTSDNIFIYGIILLVIYWQLAIIIYKYKDINY